MVRVAVGTGKSYKLDAVHAALLLLYPAERFDIVSLPVRSEVNAQPLSVDEMIRGARNRARAARTGADADVGIGLENGLFAIDGCWFATTWIACVSRSGREGLASTIARPVPPALMTLVESGRELGDAVQGWIGDDHTYAGDGLIGIITDGILRRHKVLRDGIVAAMSPLVHPEHFGPEAR